MDLRLKSNYNIEQRFGINNMDYSNIGVYNFEVIQGVGHEEFFTEWLIEGISMNLLLLDDIKVDFKKSVNSAHSSLTLTKGNGGLIVEQNILRFVFGKNTAGIAPGIYLYDILMIDKGERKIYVRGEMTLHPAITK